jgi:hypothetical protein
MNADIMNANMSVPTRQQKSVHQRMSRLKNKIFLSAYRNGDAMTPEEEERGRRLQLARIKKTKSSRALSSNS